MCYTLHVGILDIYSLAKLYTSTTYLQITLRFGVNRNNTSHFLPAWSTKNIPFALLMGVFL